MSGDIIFALILALIFVGTISWLVLYVRLKERERARAVRLSDLPERVVQQKQRKARLRAQRE